MKASEYVQNEAQHLCIYGDPGTGKSTLVVKLAEEGFKLKYFFLDDGIPLLGLSKEALDNIELFVLRDTPTFQVAIQTCREVIKGGRYNLCDFHGQIDCIPCKKAQRNFSSVFLGGMQLDEIAVFDHLSGLADSSMNTVFNGDEYIKDSADKAGYTQFRQQGWLMMDFLSRMQIAPFNTICITHQIMVDMEDNKKKLVPQCGTRDFSATAGKYFGNIIHCSVLNKEHKFGSSSTYQNGVITKSRSGVEIERMKIPSLAPFFTAKVSGQRNSNSSIETKRETPQQAQQAQTQPQVNFSIPNVSKASASDLLAKFKTKGK
jgi:hypothetical protein